MPRKTVRNVSGPSSDGDKISRPEIEKLAAEEEIRQDDGVDKSPDVPAPGTEQDAPKDIRKRCPHGRLFQCKTCDKTKPEMSPEERERRRRKLEDTVGQVYNAIFNLTAVITGEESFRLKPEERNALETTGASTVEEVAPTVSLPILAAVGHAASLAGIISGKLLDLPKQKDKKVNEILDAGKNGTAQDAEHAPVDRRDEAQGKDDARPLPFRVKMP
jgi:hypothetical protein